MQAVRWLLLEPIRMTVVLQAVRRPTAEQQGSNPGDCPVAANPDDYWVAAAIPRDSRIAESPDAYCVVAGSQVTIQSQTVERATGWQQPFQETVGSPTVGRPTGSQQAPVQKTVQTQTVKVTTGTQRSFLGLVV